MAGVLYSHSNRDVTPLMTAADAPSPNVVSTDHEDGGQEGWKAFTHTMDGGWQTDQGYDSGHPASVTFDLGDGNAKTVISYTVTKADALVSWTLYGSNNNSDWTSLDARSDITFESPPFPDNSEPSMLTYDFSNSTAYRYYKITQTHYDSYGGFAEIELLQTDPIEESPYSRSITESLGMVDSMSLEQGTSITDVINLTESQILLFGKTLTDLLFIYDTQRVGWGVTNTESLVLTDTQAIGLGIAISDWLTLIDSQTNNWNGRDIINDTLNLYDLCQGAKHYADSLSDTIDMTDTNLFGLTVTVLEYLGFTDLVSAMKTCAESLSDGVVLTDSTDRGFNFTLTEALSAVDALSVVTTFLGAITEALGLTDAVTPIKRAYPSLTESLVLAETITSQGTLYNTITETLRMSVLVELSGEVYECYVLNTPKFMPSMYSGFNFNSYCVFENRAFGANDTGIYELTGSTDAGATIHTGAVLSKTDFGAPNQKRFRRGYLGITGSNPVMVFEAEDGKREAYNIDTQGKVVASSELKSKSWKLSVADFDELDTIKLIPIILTK